MLLLIFIFNFFVKCATQNKKDFCDSLVTLIVTATNLESHVKQNISQETFMEQEVKELIKIWVKCLEADKMYIEEEDEEIVENLTILLPQLLELVKNICSIFKSINHSEFYEQKILQLRITNKDGCNDEEIKNSLEKIKKICEQIHTCIFMVEEQKNKYDLKENDFLLSLCDFYHHQLLDLQNIK